MLEVLVAELDCVTAPIPVQLFACVPAGSAPSNAAPPLAFNKKPLYPEPEMVTLTSSEGLAVAGAAMLLAAATAVLPWPFPLQLPAPELKPSAPPESEAMEAAPKASAQKRQQPIRAAPLEPPQLLPAIPSCLSSQIGSSFIVVAHRCC